MTPQIVIKILPYLLSAFVLVDSIWTLKGSRKLKKLGNSAWKVLLIGSLIFILLGLVMMFYPFSMVKYTVIFSGCVFLANGIGDIIFLILLHLGIKKGAIIPSDEQQESEKAHGVDEDNRKKGFFRKKNKTKTDVNISEDKPEIRSWNEQADSEFVDTAGTDKADYPETGENPDTRMNPDMKENTISQVLSERKDTEDEALVSPAREIKEMEEQHSLLWKDDEPLEEWKD